MRLLLRVVAPRRPRRHDVTLTVREASCTCVLAISHHSTTGTGTAEMTSCTAWSGVRPRRRTCELMWTRWTSTGLDRCCTSDGMTKSRPRSAASAWLALNRRACGEPAQIHRLMHARRTAHFDDIPPHVGVHMHLCNLRLEAAHLLARGHRGQHVHRVLSRVALEYLILLGLAGIARLHQRQGTGLAGPRAGGRCLQARWGSAWPAPGDPDQGVRLPVRGHLALLHGLQQGRLRAWRGWLISRFRKQHLGEHRAGAELELARFLVVDRQPGHIRGEQVGRELWIRAEGEVEAPRQGLGKGGLPACPAHPRSARAPRPAAPSAAARRCRSSRRSPGRR